MCKVENARKEMKKRNIDLLVVSSEPNIRYFTGQIDLGCLFIVPAKEEPFIITYAMEKKRAELSGFETFILSKKENIWKALAKILKEQKIQRKKIGYEDAWISIKIFKEIKKHLKRRLVGFSEQLLKIRSIKNKEEIKNIEKSLRIAENGMKAAREVLRPGISERELARQIEYSMRKKADWFSFKSIVASGKNAAQPHHSVTDKKIKKEETVLIDIGAVYKGYCSDISRTFCMKPNDKIKKAFKSVLETQEKTIKKIKPNVKAKEIAKCAESTLKKSDFELIHGLGHGVGVQIHELPNIGLKSKDVLKPEMVFTIEPAVYGKFGGVRLEDMILLTKKGVINLTRARKDLIP